ncbi:DndE family protein [Echinicola shivajiensis]|uniref:DndE family protein n=1 Tax=Echinicola shivajiensis TaxID=1035916 RepID=UPI001BFC3D52|nr:DndE family protein [Echinicola shivajiensis]
MQQLNIKTSEANKEIVQQLTSKLNFAAEYVICRIALAYSLSKNINLHLKNDYTDAKGKEFKDYILFGDRQSLYISMIAQHYKLHKNDPDIGKYIKLHIDDGLVRINKIFEENPHYNAFDFLSTEIESGIEALESSDISHEAIIYDEKTRKLKVKDKGAYQDLIEIEVGKTLEDAEPIKFRINDINIHNNQHIAVAGASGTGKTQFALEFLRQIVTKTNGVVNFVYLDFKGLKGDDLEYLKPFFDTTNTTYIDCPQIPFPLNPLSFIDKDNETNKKMGVGKFVDIISSFANIGKNKEQSLREGTLAAFDSHKKDEKYPSMKEIYDLVMDIEGDKQSTLKNILFSLSDYTIFESEVDPLNTFLDRNYYFSLSGDLPSEIRFTATFLIINYIYNTFMNMANTPVEDGKVGMRYVFLIDEAHNVFNNKKAQGLLDKILREIRSKGVSVFLLSQGIEEFNQPDIDFSSNCETAFLLDIKDKSNVRLMSKFLGIGEKEHNALIKNMGKIQRGESISNLKESPYLNIFRINQYRND